MKNVGESLCTNCEQEYSNCKCNANTNVSIKEWIDWTFEVLKEPYQTLYFKVLPYAQGYSDADAIDKYYLHDQSHGRDRKFV